VRVAKTAKNITAMELANAAAANTTLATTARRPRLWTTPPIKSSRAKRRDERTSAEKKLDRSGGKENVWRDPNFTTPVKSKPRLSLGAPGLLRRGGGSSSSIQEKIPFAMSSLFGPALGINHHPYHHTRHHHHHHDDDDDDDDDDNDNNMMVIPLPRNLLDEEDAAMDSLTCDIMRMDVA
jgi:hypothetical protein